MLQIDTQALPTHPTYSKRIVISNFKPPSGQIQLKRTQSLKVLMLLKHIGMNQNTLVSLLFLVPPLHLIMKSEV